MNYGETITQAFRLVWRNRHLWVLGFLMALFGGGGTNCNLGNSFSSDTQTGDNRLAEIFREAPELFIGGILILVVVLVLFFLFWFIAGLIVRPVARGAIAYSIDRLDHAEPSSFGIAWRGAWRRARSLIGISLLLELLPGLVVFGVLAIIFVLMFVPLITSAGSGMDPSGAAFGTLGGGIILICCIVLIAIPVGIFLSVWSELASISSVLGDRAMSPAIGQARRLIFERPGPVILIWLIAVVVNFVIGLIVAVPLGALALAMFGVAGFNGPTALLIPIVILFIIFFPIAAIVNGAIAAYTVSLWTLTYRALTGETGGPVADIPA